MRTTSPARAQCEYVLHVRCAIVPAAKLELLDDVTDLLKAMLVAVFYARRVRYH